MRFSHAERSEAARDVLQYFDKYAATMLMPKSGTTLTTWSVEPKAIAYSITVVTDFFQPSLWTRSTASEMPLYISYALALGS